MGFYALILLKATTFCVHNESNWINSNNESDELDRLILWVFVTKCMTKNLCDKHKIVKKDNVYKFKKTVHKNFYLRITKYYMAYV